MKALRCYQKGSQHPLEETGLEICPPTRNSETRLQGAFLETNRRNEIAKNKQQKNPKPVMLSLHH